MSVMIAVLGVGNMIVYLPVKSAAFRSIENSYTYFPANEFALHRSFSLLIGLALILISFRLSKRVKSAWLLSAFLLVLSLYLNLLRIHRPTPMSVLEAAVLVILIALRGEFNRKANPINIKKGIFLAGVSILAVLAYTVCGFLTMRKHVDSIGVFFGSFLRSAELLYFMDMSVVRPKSPAALIFARSAVLLNWTVLICALIFILKPLIYQPIAASREREKVRALLRLYGENPISYVAVENDKRYFWGQSVKGAIAYTIVRNVIVCAGDPICSEDDMLSFLGEFKAFCRKNDYQICFCQITGRLVDYFRKMGFGISKYGEECMFELEKYTLKGSAASRLRQGLRKAEKLGIRVFEYSPQNERDANLERQIVSVSNEWLSHKKSGELSFMLGTVSLYDPCDRRYFLAMDKSGILQGFIVFSPFMGGLGYMADVTRRKSDAPFGVMEKLTVDAFLKMRDEGVKWGSLGLAPLHNVEMTDYKGIVTRVFDYIYENLNMFYGFKTLYQYKKKYAPTSWESRYLAYSPKIMTPQIAYSLIKSQNPRGISDYIMSNFKKSVSLLKINLKRRLQIVSKKI